MTTDCPQMVPGISADELSARGATGVWDGVPMLVRLDVAGTEPGHLTIAADCPVITWMDTDSALRHPLLAQVVDMVVPAPWLAQVRQGCAGNPGAALVLAQLLRVTQGLDTVSALTTEAMAYGLLQGGTEFARYLAHDLPGRRVSTSARSDPRVILTQEAGAGLTITLNRRERGNAIDAQMRAALCDAFAAAAAQDRGIILRGRGKHFCIGGDLAEFGQTTDPLRAHALRMQHNLPSRMAAIGARTTVHVHGQVIGAGVELSSFAARVVCAPGTTWRLPETGMGLLPGCGGTVSVARRIGRQRTLLICLSGVTLDVETALAWGLADECVPAHVTPGPTGARAAPPA